MRHFRLIVDCNEPLRRLICGKLSQLAVFCRSFIILQWSWFFGELFGSDLLSQLITEPLLCIDTAADFLKYRAEYNLSFASFGESLKDLFTKKLIAERFETFSSVRKAVMLPLSIERNFVINTGQSGCDLLMLNDPLWQSRHYHCMSQKSPPVRMGIFLNRNFMSHPKRCQVFTLLRHIKEGSLMRRLVWTDNEMHHLRSMQASQFERHADSISALGLNEISNIIFNLGVICGLVLICQVIYTQTSKV